MRMKTREKKEGKAICFVVFLFPTNTKKNSIFFLQFNTQTKKKKTLFNSEFPLLKKRKRQKKKENIESETKNWTKVVFVLEFFPRGGKQKLDLSPPSCELVKCAF